MSEYTAADFAAARFAEHPDNGEMAMRSRTLSNLGPWETSTNYRTDKGMADMGFRPVREAAPLSLDALREAWEAAEIITPDNRPRKGDEVIESHGSTIQATTALYDWDFVDCPMKWRILRRGPRRPDKAEELEEVLSDFAIHDTDGKEYPERLADLLAERGVRVAASDD